MDARGSPTSETDSFFRRLPRASSLTRRNIIILRIGKHARHIRMARSWLGCLFIVLTPFVLFYVYLSLNGNCGDDDASTIDPFLPLPPSTENIGALLLVPSAEQRGSKIGKKWQSLPEVGTELRTEEGGRSAEGRQLGNNFEVWS